MSSSPIDSAGGAPPLGGSPSPGAGAPSLSGALGSGLQPPAGAGAGAGGDVSAQQHAGLGSSSLGGGNSIMQLIQSLMHSQGGSGGSAWG